MEYKKIIEDEKELFESRGLQMSSRSQLLINLSYHCIHKDERIKALVDIISMEREKYVNPPLMEVIRIDDKIVSVDHMKYIKNFYTKLCDMTLWQRIKWALRGET